MLPTCYAISVRFPPAQAEMGRGVQQHSTLVSTIKVYDVMGHPVNSGSEPLCDITALSQKILSQDSCYA